MNELINNETEYGHLPMISMKEVAKIIGVKTVEAATTWARENNIEIHKMCKKSMVFQIEVDKTIDILYAKGLMKKHPTTWIEKYQAIAKDTQVSQQVIEELSGLTWNLPTTRVILKNESDKKLLEQLTK
ncbi:MAG: hypothetical protein POELPBGB_00916 [Bacteroidia bacterium]|nr:hypothetical protein [Bacteroidia bacterium]